MLRGQAQYVINFTEGPSQEDVDSHWKSNGRAEMEVRCRSFRVPDVPDSCTSWPSIHILRCFCAWPTCQEDIPSFVARLAPQPARVRGNCAC